MGNWLVGAFVGFVGVFLFLLKPDELNELVTWVMASIQ
jgi:hypothetical protein